MMRSQLVKSFVTKANIKLFLAIALISTIGLATVDNAGISSDERIGIEIVYWNRDLITQNKPIPWLFKYDGTAFNFFSEVIFQVKKKTGQKLSANSEQSEGNSADNFLKRIQLKHQLTVLIAIVAYFSVAIFVGILGGFDYAWIGVISLALFPRFWGHSYFNFKDIPFAAIFTATSLFGAYLIARYVESDQHLQIVKDRTILFFTIAFGLLIGVLTGIRFGGFFILGFVPISYGLLLLATRTTGRQPLSIGLYNFGIAYLLIIVSWLFSTILLYPSSWSNPIGWIFETLAVLSKYGWSGNVLFQGEWISAQTLPWFYLPIWFSITTPLIFLVTLLGGLIISVKQFPQFSLLQRSAIIWLILQATVIPTLAIIRRSTMYDGLRHFLFVLPVIAVFSTIFIIFLFLKAKRLAPRLFLTSLLLVVASNIITTMVQLHPYEFVYFNYLAGEPKTIKHEFETDYWGLSMREAMEWLNQNISPNAKVIVGGHLHSIRPFARPDIALIPLTDSKTQKNPKDFYYLARPRDNLQKQFPQCSTVYEVQRKELILTTVKRCP